MGTFYPAPGSPIIGQIRVALTKEAIAAIQKTDDPDVPHKIEILNVEDFVTLRSPRRANQSLQPTARLGCSSP